MSKININNLTEKELAAVLKAALATEAGEKTLVAAMDKMFEDGKWTIPDDAIVGVYARKVDQLQGQVNSLTQLMSAMSAKIEGKPVAASGRVDALEAAKDKKRKK